LQGLTSKIGYLQRLGVTAIWVSPVFKQVAFQQTYHGYGIQNFLDVDPHFGCRQDLKNLVDTAHQHGIYVILDIILNHTGDMFSYDADRYDTVDDKGHHFIDSRWDNKPYKVKGFNDKAGSPAIPFVSPLNGLTGDDAVWPTEFQDPINFTQKGRINNWDYDPEFREGDFYDLKDIHTGYGDEDHYQPSPALYALCEVYKFWIAYADIDGFRVDTVKHMDLGAARFFASVIHEFAQSLGKENFYLIGEITGGRKNAFNTLSTTGLDAALGIDDIPDKLEYLVKGCRDPNEYFSLFRNSLLVQKESHVWFKDKVVTLYDDHDQVRKGNTKARFCAGDSSWRKLALNVMALNAMTLGIPCIYYGSEQYFDGEGGNDRYIRETMFGGEFGAFRSRGRHCFDEDSYLY
jgi:glycosidase